MADDIPILNFDDASVRRMAEKYVKNLRGVHRFICQKVRANRTLSQNSYLWSCVYPTVARGISEAWGETISAEDCHSFLKSKFLSRSIVDQNTGEEIGRYPGSTASLSIPEFGEYLDNIIKFSADFLQTEIPVPSHFREEPSCT